MDGDLRPAGGLGAGDGRHLRERGPGAGDDLSGDRRGELRAGRDGDVQHLPGLVDAERGRALLGGVLRHARGRLCGRAPDRARRDPARRERAGPHGRHRLHRAPGDLQQRRRLAVLLHPEAVPQPVSREAVQDRRRLLRRPRSRGTRCDAARAPLPLRLLPLHDARPRDARRRAEPRVEPALRHPGRLDARARVGVRGARRRRRRNDDRADRLPRPEHDEWHPDLRLRLRHAGWLHEPGRRGARRTHRRRRREPRRDVRALHRYRAETHGCAVLLVRPSGLFGRATVHRV